MQSPIHTHLRILFLIPIVFVLPNLGFLADFASAQPLPIIFKSAIRSSARTFGLLMPLIILDVICGIGRIAASSRCVWAFARDGAMPGAKGLMKINWKLGISLNSKLLSLIVYILLDLIYFGSSAACNAFSCVEVLTLNASYTTPTAINLLTKRKQVHECKFSLGTFGILCQYCGAWSILTIPLFCMPLRLSIEVVRVNYASVVFAAVCVVSSGWYWARGCKSYTRPPAPGLRRESHGNSLSFVSRIFICFGTEHHDA
ncbi:amino acid permease (Polyamine transporter TPO5) [Colletotrichum tofieldiae]|uniref:Amino acid permease (Polyamine transporter TPO5) n=1 Tax=Colletotrichum tofieldiae TaxID=708197 RepID=A0A161YLY0_9PEZI|nr:amino acid permease (Polyamine transporter TPO5) [Colletotrichum tofieldiae]